MLTSRKSMSNLVQNVEGPFLIHFRYWFQTKFREGSIIKFQFGKRPVTLIKNYLPGDKYVVIDIVKRNQMPSCKIQVNEQSVVIDLKKFQPGYLREHFVNLGKVKLAFAFQLLSNATQIANSYSNDRMSEDQKYRYVESIHDFTRSQAEFLSKFERDSDIDDLQKVQKAQQDLQTKLSAQLVQIKSININIKTLIMIFIIFTMIGYLVGNSDTQKKKATKKKTKKVKVK